MTQQELIKSFKQEQGLTNAAMATYFRYTIDTIFKWQAPEYKLDGSVNPCFKRMRPAVRHYVELMIKLYPHGDLKGVNHAGN